ncbi:hypothetical protein TI05_00575 [Achromatium sp. WMS3]|nr:hypothetical protein TI05_00575 [Achromatium sp. WMS3]
MQHLATHKTVSVTEMQDPAKVIREAGDTPVAILDQNKVLGYLVPNSSIAINSIKAATNNDIITALKTAQLEMQPVLDYLQDK